MAFKLLTSSYEDLLLDVEKLGEYSEECQYLVALTEWQITLILSAVRYAHWQSRWQNVTGPFQGILDKIYLMEHCLMSGCKVADLVTINRMLVAAITGEQVDLDADLPTGVYDPAGLTPKFEGDNGNVAQAVEALSLQISDLKDTIEASGDLEDDLADVWNSLRGIATVLGITIGAPPVPL